MLVDFLALFRDRRGIHLSQCKLFEWYPPWALIFRGRLACESVYPVGNGNGRGLGI